MKIVVVVVVAMVLSSCEFHIPQESEGSGRVTLKALSACTVREKIPALNTN